MSDITVPELEHGQELPKFVEPYKYKLHHSIDLVANDKTDTCFEYFSESPNNLRYSYAATAMGDMFFFYDPHVTRPSDKAVHNIIFSPNKGVESINGYAVYTEATIMAQLQIQRDIKDSVVIDFGSGSGMQSLAALKLGAKHVILFEKNDDALKEAAELMTANGFSIDKYTLILDEIENAGNYRELLADADIGIANIGDWGNYGEVHLAAINATQYSPKMRYYIAGGYSYRSFNNNDSKNWDSNDKARSEDVTLNTLKQNNFSVISKCDAHVRGVMECARTFIAKRNS